MNIQLTNIKRIEETLTGELYRATSLFNCAPGQYLDHEKTGLQILQCQPEGNHWSLLVHTSKTLSGDIEAEITGSALSWSLDQPCLLLAEGKGNFICLHWINELRLGGKTALVKHVKRVIMHEKEQFAFRPTPSKFLTPDLPGHMIAALPLLDDLGVVSRLCSDEFLPGAFDGSLIELVQSGVLQNQPWCGFIRQETYDLITPILGEPIHWHNLDNL